MHPLDVCECGDYRRDHAGETGGCFFTPNPDREREGNDGHFGAGPCYRFVLASLHSSDEPLDPMRGVEFPFAENN